ncbi:hypothetical protein BVC71_09665 [Marivivens niveibacter]|uniref:Lipoprotein n=1 Tax=Marivivens niveibacter TaxID=1930667 RepID=A0A251WX73_9RHOB|nr:hypothetical protein [Marivivens niveibacter]OUD08972.1 hypothetical protein BVC71_09665 [Marivivens niveibacter]
MYRWFLISALAAVAACGPIAPERAAQICEERAQRADGPFGNITLGTNSKSGAFASGEIGISTDYLRGTDPMTVYERCVVDLTGTGPIRPPSL